MSRLNQANRSITKATDLKDDIANVMQPYANWEDNLTPAPLSLALLGQLVRISAAHDFPINTNPSEGGFKFIRFPDSFRACLLQVCKAGCQAFNEAHKNMVQISGYIGQVPDYIKNAVGIIVQEDTDRVKALLPTELQNIEHISSECLQLAEKTKGTFSDIIHLMQELVEALISARQGYQLELENQKNILEKNIEVATEAKKRAEIAHENVNRKLTRAIVEYKQAVDSIPTGWELFGMILLSSVSNEFQRHIFLACLRMEQSEAMLNQVIEMHAKTAENLEKKNRELDDIIIELKRLEPKLIEFEKKFKVLKNGLGAMGQLKEQWEKLGQFLQFISNIVKTTQHLSDFNQTMKIAGKNKYAYDKFVKDKIYTNALNASAYAYLINMISTTYTEMSVQYLMGSVSTLGKLMNIDPNGQEFIVEMAKLQQYCTSAQDGISSIVAKNKQDFKLKCQNTVTQIQAAPKPALPPISEEEKLKLKKTVQEGFEASTLEGDETKPSDEIELMTKDEADQFI